MKKIPAKIFVAVLIFAFTAIVLNGCSGNTTAGSRVTSNVNVSANGSGGYRIGVFLKDKQIASLSLTDLQSLPEITLNISGSNEKGPTLLSVLELAGIKEFSAVTASGMLKGRVATGELTLKRSDVTDEVILSFNKQGKTKLCGTQIPDSNWIIDVAELHVE